MADKTDAPAPAEPTEITATIAGQPGAWRTRVQIPAQTHPKRAAVDHTGSFDRYDRAERDVRRTLAENGIG